MAPRPFRRNNPVDRDMPLVATILGKQIVQPRRNFVALAGESVFPKVVRCRLFPVLLHCFAGVCFPY
jgi:hypothetical protein